MKQCRRCFGVKDETQFHKKQYYCKDCQRAITKAWKERDPEWAREVGRQSYNRNLTQSRQNRVNSEARRRAIKRGVQADKNITIAALYERDQGVCQLCYQPCSKEEQSMDHRIPLAKGGSHTWGNVQLAHLSCNLQKGTKHDQL